MGFLALCYSKFYRSNCFLKDKKPTYAMYLTPLMRSVTSSVKGKTMPTNMSRPIFAKPITFGGIVGREIDGHLEILTIKQKEMPKTVPDLKSWISNYLEQQEMSSSTFSICTMILSEACCEDASTLVASVIGCNSIAWSVFSAIFFFVRSNGAHETKCRRFDFDKQSTSFQLTSALEQRVLVLKCDKENKGGFRIL